MKILLFMTLCFLCCFMMNQLFSQPGLNYSIQSAGHSFFRDTLNHRIFYYLPGNLETGKNASGKPDINYISMRYTGTGILEENPDLIRHRNILTIRITMPMISSQILSDAKADLSRRFSVAAIIKPLPVSRLDARLVFTPIGADTVVVKQGEMAAENGNGYSSSGSFWQERFFTVFLDNYSANLLEEVFVKKQGAVSFTYSFHSKGIIGTQLQETAVKTDSWSLQPDLETYPDIIKKIDINETLPAGFAILNIRNYDFANNLRNDLYEKTVQLEAEGVAGDPVKLSITFQAGNKDVTSVNFRFRYAVKLDKPYRYRIIELKTTGEEKSTEWLHAETWSALLDVTTQQQ